MNVGYEQAELGRRFLYESGGLIAIGGFAHLKSSAGQLLDYEKADQQFVLDNENAHLQACQKGASSLEGATFAPRDLFD